MPTCDVLLRHFTKLLLYVRVCILLSFVCYNIDMAQHRVYRHHAHFTVLLFYTFHAISTS